MADQNLSELKQRMRAMWTAGDFGKVAEQNTEHAVEFVKRLTIQPGMQVLDVACGTGNVAIPAAARGARVTGVDIAPNLLAQARARAAEARVEIQFDEGDAEELPYADGTFDAVVSMYGAMFAPRPERTAAELARVCKSGGTIAMANWTPTSFPAKISAAGMRYALAPPGLPPPFLWGDEAAVRDRLGHHCTEIRTERRIVWLNAPVPPAVALAKFSQSFGPLRVILDRLDESDRAAYMSDLENLWMQHNEATDGTSSVRGEYLEVVTMRA